MKASNHTIDPYDLTGQVILADYMPEFKGNYSMVFRGDLKEKLVAVKVIADTGEPKSVRRKVLRERRVWASSWHQNIHPYYGFADDPTFGPVRAPYGALISPWCNNGDAAKFLNEHGKGMPISNRIDLWKGVTEGVAYLHSQTPVIVHGDLKPGNVLIDDTGNPRICDFGLAHIFFDEPSSGLTTTTEHTGTERYLAPELVVDNADVHPTMASDVYALGCLGLDFIFRQQPYSHRKNNARGIIFADIRRGVPPATALPNLSRGVTSLMKACWSREPDARPSGFTATCTLRKKVIIIPLEIIDRVMGFAPEMRRASHSKEDTVSWRMRTQILLTLSLVSKECHKLAIPHLYGDIRFLDMEPGAFGPPLLLSTLRMNSKETLAGGQKYESYTRSLVYQFTPLWDSQLTLVDFDTIWVLMQWFGTLEYVVFKWGYGEEGLKNPYGATTLPQAVVGSALLTSVTFAGLPVGTVMDGLKAFQGLPTLQDLRIISPYGHWPLSAEDSLPSLERLSIESPPEAMGFFLFVFSRWELPRLTSFHLICQQGGNAPPLYLDDFLVSHGHFLRHLICYTRGHKILALGTVMQYCPNLQSISYPIWEPYHPDLGSRHESLVAMNLLCLVGFNRALSMSFSTTFEDTVFGRQPLSSRN